MKPRLLIATRNRGKLAEFERLLGDLFELHSIDGVPDAPHVVEDRDTFEGNACKKARELAQASGIPTLADDSGLEIDALDGAPGVYSARYAGEPCDDNANNQKVLDQLSNFTNEKRSAKFRCVLAFADVHTQMIHTETGALEGKISFRARGKNGFGYDPIFIPHGETRTLGEMSAEEKDEQSHRGRASSKMREFLIQRYRARTHVR